MSAGIDWDAIARQHQARLDAEEAAGLAPVERDEQRRAERRAQQQAEAKKRARAAARRRTSQSVPSMGTSRKGIKIDRAPKYDHDKIAQLYADGVPTAEIAEVIGCAVDTIRRVARARDLPPRQGAPSLKARCVRGHDMAVTRVRTVSGAAYCRECHRLKNARRPRFRIWPAGQKVSDPLGDDFHERIDRALKAEGLDWEAIK